MNEFKAGEVRRVILTPDVRSIDAEKRTIDFVSSTESADRYGDIIRVAGWKFENYLKNPVFLWAHNAKEPPIGKTIELRIEANPPALVQKVQFADAATYPKADTIFRLYQKGFLRAVSVGFLPLAQPKYITDEETGETTGLEFDNQELLELSAVPIPANADALARAVETGEIDSKDAALVSERSEKSDREFRDEVFARLDFLASEIAELRKSLKPTEKSADPVAELREAQREAERAGDKALVELLGIEIATQTDKPKHEEAQHKTANAIDEVLTRIMGEKQ